MTIFALKYRIGACRRFAILAAFFLVWVAAAEPAGSSGITVEPNTPTEGRWTITSAAYRMVLNLASPRIDSFEAGEHVLVGEGIGLAPTINTGAPWGPAQASVAMSGLVVTHVVLYGMRWEEQLKGDIELHFFCYPNRVVARMDIIPRAAPPTLMLGWVGEAVQAAPFPLNQASPDWRSVLGVTESLAPVAFLLPPLHKGTPGRRVAHVRIERGEGVNAHYVFNSHDIGVRSIGCMLLAASDEKGLLDLLSRETALRRMQFSVAQGRFVGYDDTMGMHRFVMKPGVDAMTISIAGPPGAVGYSPVAAVLDQQRREFRVATPDASLARIQWMRRRFDPASPARTDGAGAYVFLLEPTSDGQTLRLLRHNVDSTGESTPP